MGMLIEAAKLARIVHHRGKPGGASPIRTGLEAMRLGSIIYFLPFFFVLNPALIFHGAWYDVVFEFVSAVFGVTLIASGLQGYLVRVGPLEHNPFGLLSPALLVVAGLLLAYPEMMSNAIGLIVLIPTAAIGRQMNRGKSPKLRNKRQ